MGREGGDGIGKEREGRRGEGREWQGRGQVLTHVSIPTLACLRIFSAPIERRKEGSLVVT